MQLSVILSLCSILVGEGQLEPCNIGELIRFSSDKNSVEAFSKENEIAIITHSLGTRMVFDTLGALSKEGFFQRIMKDIGKYFGVTLKDQGDGDDKTLIEISNQLDRLREPILGSVGKIFAFANQVPLIDLSVGGYPSFVAGNPPVRELGVDFTKFLEVSGQLRSSQDKERTRSPIQLVSFTDEDDILSYNLKCWYFRHVVRYKYRDEIAQMARDYVSKIIGIPVEELRSDYIEYGEFYRKLNGNCGKVATADGGKEDHDVYDDVWKLVDSILFANVTVSLVGVKLPWVFANPAAAHSNYFEERLIFNLIACGHESNKKLAGNARCH